VKAYAIGVCRALEELWVLHEHVPYEDLINRVALGVQITHVELKPITSNLLLELTDSKVSR
jgi:hypothetical protein